MAGCRRQFTIGSVMWLIAVIAFLCAPPVIARSLLILAHFLLIVTAVVVAVLFFNVAGNVILTSSFEGRGAMCPYCRRRTLWPLARPRRPYWYYRCEHCAGRVKRR